VSVVGLGTKATFVIPLAVVVGGLVLAALVRRVAGERRAPLRMVLVALGALAAAVAANAWFYLINLERSGSLHRSSPKAPVGGRAHRSTADVLGDLDFWTVVGRGFIGRAEPDHERFTAMSALVVGAMLVAGLAALVAVVLRRRRLPAMTGVVGLMLVLLVVGAYVSQLSHATGYGAYNFRYFMPAMVAIAFLLAAGLAIVPRVGLPIVIAAAAFFGAMNAFSATLYAMSMQRIPEFGPGIPLLIADRNGIAPAAIVACVVVAVGAVLALLVLSFGPLAARRSAHPESNLERTGA
ncbi:MAG: hypothetical protein GXX90_07115, partial [Microbacteriaceae bacterium]|nr:hypothetical protein [Microbacteriaceae bacterium]